MNRLKLLIFSLCATCLSACSSMMAKSSQYADVLVPGTPRTTVVASLGAPKLSEPITNDKYAVNKDGRPCFQDVYVVKGRVPELNLSDNYMNLNVMTLGIAEVVLFPIEVIRSAVSAFTTKDLFVMYCPSAEGDILSGRPWH